MYDMPTEIDVQAEGPLRIITLTSRSKRDRVQLDRRLSAPFRILQLAEPRGL